MRYIKYSKSLRYLARVMERVTQTVNADNPNERITEYDVMPIRGRVPLLYKLTCHSEIQEGCGMLRVFTGTGETLKYRYLELQDWSILGASLGESPPARYYNPIT